MGITSRFEIFSDEQVITATAESTNSYDFIGQGDSLGEEQYLIVNTTEAFNTLTSLTVELFTHTEDTDIVTSGKLLASYSIALADLVAGATHVRARLPIGVQKTLKLNYDVVGTDPTTGKISARLEQGAEKLHTT